MAKSLGLMVVAFALLGVPSVSQADAAESSSWQQGSSTDCPTRRQVRRRRGHQVPSVPELDPNMAGQAMALLAGAGWLVLGRSRRKLTA